jgi:WD40 repeat protein
MNDRWDFAFEADGSGIILGIDEESRTATVWDFAADETSTVPLNQIRPSAGRHLSADGRLFAMCRPHGTLRIIELASGVPLWHVAIGWTADRSFSPAAVAPPRIVAPIGGDQRDVGVWDARTGVRLGILRGHTDEVYAVAWSPDGSRIVTGGRDQVIRIWDADLYEEVARLQGHRSYVKALAFAPDGQTLYSAGGDHTVRLWGVTPFRESMRGKTE